MDRVAQAVTKSSQHGRRALAAMTQREVGTEHQVAKVELVSQGRDELLGAELRELGGEGDGHYMIDPGGADQLDALVDGREHDDVQPWP